MSYHDGMGEVAVGLTLQPHGVELGSHVALRSGLVQSGLPDAGHLGGYEERQHALREDADTKSQSQTDASEKLNIEQIWTIRCASFLSLSFLCAVVLN